MIEAIEKIIRENKAAITLDYPFPNKKYVCLFHKNGRGYTIICGVTNGSVDVGMFIPGTPPAIAYLKRARKQVDPRYIGIFDQLANILNG